MAKGIEIERRPLFVVLLCSVFSSSCSMFRNGLKSMLRSRNHEGCCCAATFNCMGKGWLGVQMFLLSSCQDLIVEKWVNLTLNKTIDLGLVLFVL